MSDPKPSMTEFSDVDKSENSQYFVDYLDLVRSNVSGIMEYKELLFSLLALKPGDHALDIGCGTGDDVVSLAKIVGEKGRAVGIDSSDAMISEAKRRAGKSNTSNVQYLTGSIYDIEFPDETFNGVLADRVFMHLEDPRKALGEMVRVAKRKNGRVVVHDPDWDSLVIDSSSKDVTRNIVRSHSDSLKNGTIGRRMYGLFKEAGLANITVGGRVAIFTEYDPAYRLLNFEKASEAAVEKGLITANERTEWISEQQERGEQGRFFASFLALRVAGTRP